MQPRAKRDRDLDPWVGHILTPSEARVMALWDEGLAPRVIAITLGVSEASVIKLTKYYDDSDPGAATRAAAEANIRFIDRMRAIYPWRFGAPRLDEPGASEGMLA